MKPLMCTINVLFVISIAYVSVQIFYTHFDKGVFEKAGVGQTDIAPAKSNKSLINSAVKNPYGPIIARNLFNVQVEEKSSPKERPPAKNDLKDLKSTRLDLTLWGTVTGTRNTYAVIEDNQNKVQALYQIGDSVQEAVIKRILRDKVILTFQQQDYILESDIKFSPDSPVPAQTREETEKKSEEITIRQNLLTSSLDNIEGLKRQIRIKPVMTKGKPDGLLLYSIKPNSFFHTLGLKNGDIIQQVNGNPTLSIADAVTLYQSLENPSRVMVSLLRNGKNHTVVYHVKPD